MRNRHLKLLSLWIVPLLLARALIPTGFMLTADRGGLQLTFCPAGIYQPAGALNDTQSAAHAGHHDAGQQDPAQHNVDHSKHQSDGADSTACPFSLVASAVSCDIPALRAAAAAPADEVADFISAPAFGAGPVRADRIRGPPSFS